MTQPAKPVTTRRRFVKYVVGIAAALAAAVLGYGLFARRREEVPPSQTTERTVPQGYADMILVR